MLGWTAAGVPCSPFRSATPHSTTSRARRFPLQMIFNCSIFDGNHCSNLDGSGQQRNVNIGGKQAQGVVHSEQLHFYFTMLVSNRRLSSSFRESNWGRNSLRRGSAGGDCIFSGLMGEPFFQTRKSRWGPVERPVEPT